MFNLKGKIAKEIIESVKKGGILVIPTDTIYGIVASALNKESVERLYKIRKRNLHKPMIILINSIKDLGIFGIKVQKEKDLLKKIWPGKVSVIFECLNKKYEYLHRGRKTLAFRIPGNKNLVKLLKKMGPLVAPSANIEGKKPSQTIEEAMAYFEDKVDFYVDVGKMKSRPSKLVSVKNGKVEVIRK